jgi:hypothetical protein
MESTFWFMWEDGKPCDDDGCSRHFKTPCENCGRLGMQGTAPRKIRGVLFLWAEQGLSGGWAIQDERHIKPPTTDWPHESWSYSGLYLVKEGDYLKAFNADGSVFWEGELKSLTKRGDPVWEDGWVDKQTWGEMFVREMKGEITRR